MKKAKSKKQKAKGKKQAFFTLFSLFNREIMLDNYSLIIVSDSDVRKTDE